MALHAISEHALFITPTFSSLDIKFSYPNGQKTMQVTYGRTLNMAEIEVSYLLYIHKIFKLYIIHIYTSILNFNFRFHQMFHLWKSKLLELVLE